MKITCWCDFICPNSYIGVYRLKNAINELNLNFQWQMKAFELKDYTFDFEVQEIAACEGLKINLNGLEISDTRNAHRLCKFIQNKNPSLTQTFTEKVFESYFAKNQDISNITILTDIAAGLGFLKGEVFDVLTGNKYDIEVEMDIEDAIFNGIYAVPHFIISVNTHSLIVPGAFEKNAFKMAISDMMSGEIKDKTFI